MKRLFSVLICACLLTGCAAAKAPAAPVEDTDTTTPATTAAAAPTQAITTAKPLPTDAPTQDLLIIREIGHWTGAFNGAREVVFPFEYSSIYRLENTDLYFLGREDGATLAFKDGTIVTDALHGAISISFDNTLLAVAMGENQYRLYDIKNRQWVDTGNLLKDIYHTGFQGDALLVHSGPSRTLAIYRQADVLAGQAQPIAQFEGIESFDSYSDPGDNFVLVARAGEGDNLSGVINTAGEILVPMEYGYIQLGKDHFVAMRDQLHTYLDLKGRPMAGLDAYPAAEPFVDGVASVTTADGGWALINRQGKTLASGPASEFLSGSYNSAAWVIVQRDAVGSATLLDLLLRSGERYSLPIDPAVIAQYDNHDLRLEKNRVVYSGYTYQDTVSAATCGLFDPQSRQWVIEPNVYDYMYKSREYWLCSRKTYPRSPHQVLDVIDDNGRQLATGFKIIERVDGNLICGEKGFNFVVEDMATGDTLYRESLFATTDIDR